MAENPRIPELLAPAGDWECARAAVENGADAIYFGLERFNARMRAKNFTLKDLPSLMEFLHKRGVRGYATFNTLVFADELKDAEDYLRAIISGGADAAIVQDIGVCRMIRALSPDFPIHCSTQMTITSGAGIEFARGLGAQLVVLARENSLSDIAKIQEAQAGARQIPLEVFVHGALCVAFSGQCLTSEALGGRSANRGECAQACRLPYDLISDGEKVPLGDRRYLLSPQDLAGLEVLSALAQTGVSSLKIEGRLKSPEYVASITRVYRRALDALAVEGAGSALPNESKADRPTLKQTRYELEMSFSRGLSPGWFNGSDNQSLVHARFGTKRGVYLGTVSLVEREAVVLRLESPLKPGDGVVFDAGRPDLKEEGGRVYQVEPTPTSDSRLRFGDGDIDWKRVRAGQKVWKTDDPALNRELRATFAGDVIRFRRPVVIQVSGRAGEPLTIEVCDEQGLFASAQSTLPLVAAHNQPLDQTRLLAQFDRLGGTPFRLKELHSTVEGEVMLPISELNRMRREVIETLGALRSRPPRWKLRTERLASPLVPGSATQDKPELIALIRLPEQLQAAWDSGVRTIYCEFENPKTYRDTVAEFRHLQVGEPEGSSIWVAPPRVFLPGEDWIIEQVRSSAPDGFLARNYDHLYRFAGARLRGDFSFNVANPWSADYFLTRFNLERVTASYDLNIDQLDALLTSAPAGSFDITLHQHMPMFHMNHCVFCAFLSTGKDYRDCGRPCEKHRVSLRDRVGADLPLKADAGCRNTVYNNRAQTGAEFAARLISIGARHFRIDFVNEPKAEVTQTLGRYRSLLAGEIAGSELWRELKLIHQLGVTRGQMSGAHVK